MQVKELIERLEDIERNCENDYGLYNGKTGLCLAYYLIGTLLNKESYLTKAEELLDEIGENIDKIQGFNFENGLAGIGWTIEWLIQHKLLSANSDEVLEDMDDELYKSVVFSKSDNSSLKNGTIGKALFFYRRLIARNPNTSRYRNICNQECLILLVDELDDLLLSEEKEITYDEVINSFARLQELAQSLLFIAKKGHLKLNNEISIRLTHQIGKFANKYFLSDEFINAELLEANLYLIYACFKAGEYLCDNTFIVLARAAYLRIDNIINFDTKLSSFTKFILFKLSLRMNLTQKNKFVLEYNPTDIFNLLALITVNTENIKFDWEEGWGL